MDIAEIEAYTTKLAEVELALSADPESADLQMLKQEIQDLLELTKQLYEPAPQPLQAATALMASALNTDKSLETLPQIATRAWQIGDDCEARYAADSQFYPARIVAVRDNGYQVAFIGYGDMQEVQPLDLRELTKPTKPADRPASQPGHNPKPVKQGRVDKKKGGKADAGSVASSQQAWLKFAKGGASKKLKVKAINDKSIFKSPDTATGKVGVSNSGKGMTKNPSLSKL
ncbi:hypothetical protein GGF37_005946 [Kickxella alabastrina]|nr:hypothetical protein GGF37_005946 [Kickxella alabastrina]